LIYFNAERSILFNYKAKYWTIVSEKRAMNAMQLLVKKLIITVFFKFVWIVNLRIYIGLSRAGQVKIFRVHTI